MVRLLLGNVPIILTIFYVGTLIDTTKIFGNIRCLNNAFTGPLLHNRPQVHSVHNENSFCRQKWAFLSEITLKIKYFGLLDHVPVVNTDSMTTDCEHWVQSRLHSDSVCLVSLVILTYIIAHFNDRFYKK